jgi:response regulator RpfG family c-di-GMP phosphodiesterase
MTDRRPLVLIVDDDPTIGSVLGDVLQPTYETRSVTSAKAALVILQEVDVAIVLADQQMPEMTGLELLAEMRRVKPTAVGVLLTAYADLDDAMRAINSVRVIGFLTKPWDEQELLSVVERALEAHETLISLSRPSGANEIRLLEVLSNAPTPVTAQRFGVLPLQRAMPREFDQLVLVYTEILGKALDQRAFKVDHRTSQTLQELADQLGALSAGPRDIVDLHVTALKRRLLRVGGDQATALTEEGRLLVLELMGHLVTYYRSYTLGVRA